MKKIIKGIRIFCKNIAYIIDKKIILPITKLIFGVTSKFDKSGRKFENWLSKSNTLLFISLFLAFAIFIAVDQKILIFSESSAEVLKSQPVNVIYNEEAFVIEGLPETVDVTLIGSKTDLYIAKQSPSYDITVDLSGLKPGTHKVNIKYNQASGSIDYKVNPSVATVIIYPKVSTTKKLSYDLLNEDKIDSKLVVKDVNIEKDKVVVKGAEHQISEVATVKALIDLKNIVKQEVGINTLTDVPLKAYNEKGEVVDVEIVPAKMDIEIELASPSKELPIKVIPIGNVVFGKAINSINISETKVLVYGDDEVLNKLQYIPLNVDVADLNSNKQYKLELDKPVGVKSMNVNNVTVSITLEKSAEIKLNGVNIEYKNLNDAYAVQGASEDDIAVDINLTGVKSIIENIKAEDVTAYLDLKGYGEGEHEVEVHVEGNDVKVQYVPMTKKVKIRIIKK